MSGGDASLVASLVQRLATRLPHRTGSSSADLDHDYLATLTRSTLIDISSTNISRVAEAILRLLEDLSKPFKAISKHPTHVLHSELYLLHLLADCCKAHWSSLNVSEKNGARSPAPGHSRGKSLSLSEANGQPSNKFSSGSRIRANTPAALGDGLVRRTLASVRLFLGPIPEDFVIPATSILLQGSAAGDSEHTTDGLSSELSLPSARETAELLRNKAEEIETYVRSIIEYVSASNWTLVIDYVRTELRGAQITQPVQGSNSQYALVTDEEKSFLVSFRFIAMLWVDGRKLGQVIQEVCGSFLHFRKPFQHTIAIVLPLLIFRWIEQNPKDFVDLHTSHKRLDGGADTLFDMVNTNTITDHVRLKMVLLPFQATLLFLLPDVWDVASGMRDAKSSSMSKKVAYLEGLRKQTRNRNEAAAYCLVTLLRVARHFSHESDSTLLSYALDVEDEVREAMFRRQGPGADTTLFTPGLLTAAFVSIVHLDFDASLDSFVSLCLTPNAPQDYKVAYVDACCHFARQNDAAAYQPFYSKLAPFIRSCFKALTLDGPGYDGLRGPSRSGNGGSTTGLMYHILTFLNLQPMNVYDGAPMEWPERGRFFDEAFILFVTCLSLDDEILRGLAAAVAKLVLYGITAFTLSRTTGGVVSRNFYSRFWHSTSIVLLTLSDKMLALEHQEKSTLNHMKNYLQTRVDLVKISKDLSELQEESIERITANERLDTVLLVLLCSADIEVCQVVTACIGLLCEEYSVCQSSSVPSNKATSGGKKDLNAYIELSSKNFRFTGPVAFQKRVRTILRSMKYPTPGILAAWGIIFKRWLAISMQISSNRPTSDSSSEQTLVEWRNFSGFLASLGGLCISEQASSIDETGLVGLKWIDRQSLEDYDETFLDRYLLESVQLLACNDVRVRETTREVLSTDISPALHLHLFRILETELESMFDTSQGGSRPQDSHLIFAEQAAALLKAIVEKVGNTDSLPTLSIDVGALTLNFVRFIDHAPDGSSTLRIKLKLCQLCEIVTQKKELLNLRHDVRIRNQLLDIMFKWVARPGSPHDNVSVSRFDETQRLQKDLDKACLKALADLTYRLPLQPAEGQSDAETSDTKVLLFRTYFNRFLSLLSSESMERLDTTTGSNRDESVPIHELAIRALSNLLSANIDIGLRHCLSIGYNENTLIRTAFVRVLCNVLAQGTTDFHNLSDAAMTEKYEILLELLVNDFAFTIALCDACPSSEVDELTISLLNIFDSRGLGFKLLQALIEHEVEETESEAELLRRNCVTTKMLSIYAKWKGSTYLKTTLQSVLERLLVTAKDLDLELDPARTTSAEELQKNALQLRHVTKVFIDDICRSADHIPVSFRHICNIISSSVMLRFPDAKFTAVGAFIFLRFFCPAIVAPDSEGLINSPPSKEMRRGLLLIAKVVQNLANNVLFGAKESYMFPLNDFLTENIYRVTTFLREISAPSSIPDLETHMEAFDFGSCVALHRFLYDHWDHVRQKLLAQERKLSVHSPLDISKGRIPIVEALRGLISNLGPPPMDVSWNRPSITFNNPPAYSRFQHFMLRNSGRSTESLVSSRAVYDGGESKDGLSMICIILRNIDTDTIDYDLLLYCYLKISSRMWHKPFGILLDATCYNGQNEPQDALFRKLDQLTPAELFNNLTRVYVYNMNSAFRKCFRRVLRLSAKSEQSAFHPTNVDYHLIGSMSDLQSHFHLSQLNLPKETISMVTDTRYKFQPVTRLSKTKGKIDVIINVGSQYVQVTTTKKQEIVPGLRLHATVNDIFRLVEVDEAPTSIQAEDESAFGLRTENGKIVMYFTSPKRADIISAIRNARTKHGKDVKYTSTFERLIRPQDVPGTLLNIAFTNLASLDPNLRLSSYNLLCELCQAFNFASDVTKFATAHELAVPRNPSHFIMEMSKQLALSEPQLTADFLNEFFVGWDSFPLHQRPLSLAYMAPWLPSLRSHVMITEPEGEKAKEKIMGIFRKLIDVAISDNSLTTVLEQTVWPSICHDEALAELFFEEVIRTALNFGPDDHRVDILGSIVAASGTTTIRGRILSKLRKVLNRTSLRPTRRLADNNVWAELCVFIRLCVSVSFDSGVQAQLFLPELFHIITMLSNTGSADAKLSVHRLLVNSIHAICTTFSLDDVKMARLKSILSYLTESRNETATQQVGFSRDALFFTLSPEPSTALASTEALAKLLSEVTIIAAPNIDLSNTWRARWMSLVASTAFQSNPAIQPRAFVVMGCLAREDVDDDLLYQVLVALRNSVNRLIEDNDHEMLVAIVTSLTKMMEKLPTASRYGLQLFWLALSLVRIVPLGLFNCSALLLEAALLNIKTSGEFSDGKMVSVLLHGRMSVDEVCVPLDESYGVHFNAENFHFAICTILMKGLSDTVTKAVTLQLMSTFLDVATTTASEFGAFPHDVSLFAYLSILVARAGSIEQAKDILWLAGLKSEGQTPETVLAMINLDTVKDKELLLTAALCVIDFEYLEDHVQNRGLDWLNRVAHKRPTVILHLYKPVLGVLDEVLLSCQNSTTLEAAHNLLRTLTSNPKFSGRLDTEELLHEVLDGIGFEGLWRAAKFHGSPDVTRQGTLLADKLIELIIA